MKYTRPGSRTTGDRTQTRGSGVAAGKTTRVQALMSSRAAPRPGPATPAVQAKPRAAAPTPADPMLGDMPYVDALQLAHGDDDGGQGEPRGPTAHEHADQGTRTSGAPLPHLDAIQQAFGKHDVTDVRAHVGGAASKASEALSAEAYAMGTHVAFRGAPDLHTAAHEAAHVVQQRSGVTLPGGMGARGDAYEQHADAVADTVVRGESAEGLLEHTPAAPGTSRPPAGAQEPAAPGQEPSPADAHGASAPAASGTEANAGGAEADIAGAETDEQEPGAVDRSPKDEAIRANHGDGAGVPYAGATVDGASSPESAPAAPATEPSAMGIQRDVREVDVLSGPIAALSGTRASRFGEAMDRLRQEMPGLQEQEQEAFKEALPSEIPPLTGLPTYQQVTGRQAPPTLEEQRTAVENAPAPAPVENAPDTSGVPSHQAEAQAAKEQIAQNKDAAQRSRRERANKDPIAAATRSHMPVTMGPRPRVDLRGAANPARIEQQTAHTNARIQDTRASLSIDALAPELALYPREERAPTPLDIELPAPPAPRGFEQARVSANHPGQSDEAVAALDQARAPQVTEHVNRMLDDYEARRAAHQQRMLEAQQQTEQAIQARQEEVRMEQLAAQQQAREKISAIKSEWRANDQARAQTHLARTHRLTQDTHRLIDTQVQRAETQASERFMRAEQQATRRKAGAEQQAAAKVAEGQARADAILAGISPSGDAQGPAVQRQEVSTPTAEAPAQSSPEDTAAAIAQAQDEINAKVQYAQELLNTMETEIEAFMNMTEEEQQAAYDDLMKTIEDTMSQVGTILGDLQSNYQGAAQTEATAAIMRINTDVILAVDQAFGPVDTAKESILQLQISMLYNMHISTYQEDIYFIFAPAPSLDVDVLGSQNPAAANNPNERGTGNQQYLHMPFSQMATSVLDQDPTLTGNLMYAPYAPGDPSGALESMMSTITMLNPDAQFVLSGHSAGAETIAAATQTYDQAVISGAMGNGFVHPGRRIRELMFFDPSLEHDYTALATPDREISVFGAEDPDSPGSVFYYPYDGQLGPAQPLAVNGRTSGPRGPGWDLHYPLAGDLTADGARQAADDALTETVAGVGASLQVTNDSDIVTHGGLSLRTQPGSSTTVTTPGMNSNGRIDIGQSVTVATPPSGDSHVATDSDGGRWIYVTFNDSDQGGWVSLSHGDYATRRRTSIFP